MKRFIRYMREKKLKKWDVLFVILLTAGLFYLYQYACKTDGLFQGQMEIVNGYMAKQDDAGNTYIVDQEHTRILKLNRDKQAEFSIRGNDRDPDTISYVGDMAIAPNGDIFVEENHWGGMYVDREAILVYDSEGNYKATCYEDLYDDEYVDKRKIFGMTTDDTYLYFVLLQRDEIGVYQMDMASYEIVPVKTLEYANAFNAVYDVVIDYESNALYVLDKRCQVVRFDESGRQVLYDSARDTLYRGQVAFYNMAVSADGQVFLTDIKGSRIFRLDEQENGQRQLTVLLEGDWAQSIKAAVGADGETRMSAIYGGMLYELDTQGNVLFSGAQVPRASSLLVSTVMIYIALGLGTVAALWLLVRLILLLSQMNMSDVTRNALMISAVVVVVVSLVVGQLMSAFQDVYTKELFDKLSISAHMVSSQIDETLMEDVNTPEDFMSDAYNELMSALYSVINREYEFNQSIYVNILKYVDGEAFSIAYLDQSTGTYYPLDEIETEEVRLVYETGEEMKNDGKADVAGSFAYVKVPVFNEMDEVIAVIAVGSDTSIISNQISEMQGIVLITLVTIIVVLLFLFGEILGFFDLRSKYKASAAQNRSAVPLHMVRLVIFITFLAFNMATSFLPVYAARLVSESIGIPSELAASLPLTLNLAFMGIMSMFCAPLMARFKFKTIAVVSACICLAGDMTIFLNDHYYALLGGLILNGIGVGVITNCINMFIASSDDMDIKRDGFTILNSGSISGINIGSMVGASLAGAMSQQQVFAVSSGAWILVAVLFLILGKHISSAPKASVAGGHTRKVGFGRFIASPRVLGYMLCIQIPYIMLNSFIYYYVPLYGAEQGFSETIVSLLLMVNSLCSVFFGVALTNFFVGKFRQMSIYISTGMSLLALLLFAANPTVSMLVLALLIMGISSSFGVSSKSVYFTELPQVKAYGEEESMGVYNLSDNVGESVGPMIFSGLMSSGNLLLSMGKFVGVIFAAGAAYAVGSLRKGRKTPKA